MWCVPAASAVVVNVAEPSARTGTTARVVDPSLKVNDPEYAGSPAGGADDLWTARALAAAVRSCGNNTVRSAVNVTVPPGVLPPGVAGCTVALKTVVCPTAAPVGAKNTVAVGALAVDLTVWVTVFDTLPAYWAPPL